jgi:hypothetical protein
VNQEIIDAITELRALELRYNGYTRTVEPHAYGRDKSGDEILRCFQTGGGSQSGERVGWKLLKVADAYTIHKLQQSFSQHAEYKRNDKAMDYMFRQL